MKIEALHEFHDQNFSEQWANRFTPTKDRIALFNTISQNIINNREFRVLELGIGPGYLANYLLGNHEDIQYEGLDFSEPMLNLARKRNAKFKERISFTQADLVNEVWINKVIRKPNIVVSTWALHDLLSKQNILNVYKSMFELLPKGGLLVNGDFIKPEESNFEYEAGRIKPSEHIEMLKSIGFQSVECIGEFEKDVENPTTANNYSCFRARKQGRLTS